MGLLLAELRKLWTVRTTWALTAIGWGLVALTTGVLLFSELLIGPFTGTAEQVAAAVDQIGGTSILVLIVALLAMTTEFRHGTIGRTLQLVPGRARLLAAKLGVGVLYAVFFFVTSLVIVVVLLLSAMGIEGVALQFGEPVATALWQGLVGLALNAMFGVAIGALIRSQVVAITLTFVWMMIVESLVANFFPAVGRWLPFQALNAVFVSSEMGVGVDGTEVDPSAGLLAPMAGLTTFLAYVVVATVVAGVLLSRRDV